MSARYWVGNSGTWDAADTTHWSATDGGAGGASVPGASDDVIINANSGTGTITVATDFSVISLTCGAMGMTLDFSANNNSPTMQTFSASGTGVRTLNMGSGTFTITGNATTIVDVGTFTNLTVIANTSTWNCTYSGSTGTRSLQTGGSMAIPVTNTLNVTAGSDALRLLGSTYTNLSLVGYTGTLGTGAGNTIYGSLTTDSNMSVGTFVSSFTFAATSGTKAITSGGFSWNSPVTFNGVGGTWQLADAFSTKALITLTNGTFDANNFNVTASAFASSNSNVRVLTMGSGTWTLTGNNTTIFNIGTSTNLTITATTSTINCTYSGATGTRTFAGGGASSQVGNFKISAGTDTISFSSSTWAVKDFDLTGFSGVWAGGSNQINATGNFTISATLSSRTYTGLIGLVGTGAQVFTSNGITLDSSITISGIGASVTLADDLVSGVTKTLTLTQTSLNANNKDITIGAFASSNANVRTITMGSGTMTLTGTGTVWNTATTTGLTLDRGTSTILVNDASSSSKTIEPGATTLYDVVFGGAGTGTFILGTATSTSTFNKISITTPPHTLQIFAGKTIVTTYISWSGSSGNINVLESTTGASAWTLSVASGSVGVDYVTLQDSTADGGATFFYGSHSTSISGNTGWNLGYALNYYAGSNGTLVGNPSQGVASGGSGTAVVAAPNAGYFFTGWNDFVANQTRIDTNVTNDILVTAGFGRNTMSAFTGKDGFLKRRKRKSI